MADTAKPQPTAWVEEIDNLGRTLKDLASGCRHLPSNPFQARAFIDVHVTTLKKRGLEGLLPSPLMQQRQTLQDACTLHVAEFWKNLAEACTQEGWELHGTTSRRLFCRGPFIELKNETVLVEGISATLTPYVPDLKNALKAHAEQLLPARLEMPAFMEQLAKAYGRVASQTTERPIEEVYRQWVLLAQKPAFWCNLDVKLFTPLGRAIFRARLTEALRAGQRTADGRELRLGTTTQAKEAWELFSPGEGLVVQMGRLALVQSER